MIRRRKRAKPENFLQKITSTRRRKRARRVAPPRVTEGGETSPTNHSASDREMVLRVKEKGFSAFKPKKGRNGEKDGFKKTPDQRLLKEGGLVKAIRNRSNGVKELTGVTPKEITKIGVKILKKTVQLRKCQRKNYQKKGELIDERGYVGK